MEVEPALVVMLDQLPNASDKVEALKHIKTLLGSMPLETIGNVVSNVSFNIVFELLRTADSEQVTLCCGVISRLLSAVDASALLPPYHQQLMEGLADANPRIQKLCMEQLLRIAETNSQQVCQCSDIVVELVKLVASAESDVNETAIRVLTPLGGRYEDLADLLQGPVLTQIEEVSRGTDIVRFRIYELAVGWASSGPRSLQLLHSHGLLQSLASELSRDDVLLQLNCLELLTTLAGTPHGWRYLVADGITARLHGMLRGVEEDPMARLLLPGLVKFFGNVGRHHPEEVCESFPQLIALITTLLEGRGDPTLQCIAIETIGFIGQSPDGKRAIAKYSETMDVACRTMGQVISSASSSEARVRTLHALCRLLQLPPADQTSDLLALTESWFRQLCRAPLDVVLRIAREPFQDVRVANLQLLAELMAQAWAQHRLNAHAAFREWLVDRATETTVDARRAKYDVVCRLAAAAGASDVFGAAYAAKLREYARTGPYGHTAQPVVAVQQG